MKSPVHGIRCMKPFFGASISVMHTQYWRRLSSQWRLQDLDFQYVLYL